MGHVKSGEHCKILTAISSIVKRKKGRFLVY